MATPNYSFEKRKRELAKKAAKEAKKLRKGEQAAASEAAGTAEEPTANGANTPTDIAADA